jgi:FAD:protein FMN transferase
MAKDQMPFSPARRRVLRLIAATSAASCGALAANTQPEDIARNSVRWRGRVLGSPADVVLHHPDPQAAGAMLAAMDDELARLEAIFSLYRADSVINRLNRTGELTPAPPEFIEMLEVCAGLHRLTDGAFDPTVQPLWTLYTKHFAESSANDAGPSMEAVADAISRVGFGWVMREGQTLRFARANLALTLNGIAQGYFTDRVRDLLAEAGMEYALINLGEYRALGSRVDGEAWQIAVSHPLLPWRTLGRVALKPGDAVATSTPAGTAFDAKLRHHHLFDPQSGRSAESWQSASVIAPNATLADGLSTALAVAPRDSAAAILARFPGTSALLYDGDETLLKLGAAFAPA